MVVEQGRQAYNNTPRKCLGNWIPAFAGMTVWNHRIYTLASDPASKYE